MTDPDRTLATVDRDLALAKTVNALVSAVAAQRRTVAAVRYLTAPLTYAADTARARDHLDGAVEEIEKSAKTLAEAIKLAGVAAGAEERATDDEEEA
jgi:hypothetical protein